MISYSDARAADHWLLDIDIGPILRYASESLVATDSDGIEYLYQEGLGDLDVSLTGDGTAESSVTVVITSNEDWPLHEARGHGLLRARCTLRRWWDGLDLDRAQVYLVGLVTSVQYGEPGEELRITISTAPALEATLAPPVSALVSSRTWPVAGGTQVSQKVEGTYAPLVIGCPGHDPSAAAPRAAVPSLAAEWVTNWVIAYGTITASTVRHHDVTAITSEDRTPATKANLLGATHTYVTPAATAGAEDSEFWWGVDAANGGGLENPFDPGQPLRGAGDVIAWVLRTYTTIQVDWGRQMAHRAWLNRYKVDTYINTPTNMWAWLTGAVLRWVPVVARRSSTGLYLLPVKRDLYPSDVVAALSVDRGELERVSPLVRSSKGIVNEVTVNYRPARDAGKWYATRTIGPRQGYADGALGTTADTSVVASYLARRSQQTYGIRPRTIEIRETWDDATAVQVAIDALLADSMPPVIGSYLGGSELSAIEPGDTISVTDATMRQTDALAYVMDAAPEPDGVRLELLVPHHPARWASVP